MQRAAAMQHRYREPALLQEFTNQVAYHGIVVDDENMRFHAVDSNRRTANVNQQFLTAYFLRMPFL